MLPEKRPSGGPVLSNVHLHVTGVEEDEAGDVAGAGIGQSAMIWIQSSQKEGHEMAVFEVFQKHLVDSSENVIEIQLHSSEAAHVGPGERHDQGGAEAMPFGIGHAIRSEPSAMEMKSK